MKTRIIYSDILRIIAVFAVITLHCAESYANQVDFNSYSWLIYNFYNSISRWCVPIFFMVSGMFLLNPEKEYTTKYFINNRILRIVFALLFWGTFYGFYNLLTKIIFNETTFTIINVTKVFAKIVFGLPWYHLWFLYAILGLYILTPILRIITKHGNKKILEYVIILFLIYNSIIPFINTLLYKIDPKVQLHFYIAELTGWMGFFISGYYFMKFDISRKLKSAIHFAGLFGLLFTIIGSSLYSLKQNATEPIFYSFFSPNVIFISFSIFIFCKDYYTKTLLSAKASKVVQYISNFTFGIYLVHDIFIQLFINISLFPIHFHPILQIPMLSIIIFILSFSIIYILKPIPILKKYII